MLLALSGLPTHSLGQAQFKRCGCQSRTQSCPQRNILRGQICTYSCNESPHKAILAFIPTGTRAHSLPLPSTMEMLRNEGQEQHGCRRSSSGERLGKFLQVQVGFQRLPSHCLEMEEAKGSSRPQEHKKHGPRR